jgi:hypothetical protein
MLSLDMGEQEHSYTVGGHEIGATTMEISMEAPEETKNTTI